MNDNNDTIGYDEVIYNRRDEAGIVNVNECYDHPRGEGDQRNTPPNNIHTTATAASTSDTKSVPPGTVIDHAVQDHEGDEKELPVEVSSAMDGDKNLIGEVVAECVPSSPMDNDSKEEKGMGRLKTTESTIFTRPLIPVGAIRASGSPHKVLGQSKTKRDVNGTRNQHESGRGVGLTNLSSAPSPPLRPNTASCTKAGLRRTQQAVSPSATQPTIAGTTKAGLRRNQAPSSSAPHNVTASQATSKDCVDVVLMASSQAQPTVAILARHQFWLPAPILWRERSLVLR